MTLKGIRAGDILECDIRGDRFFGIVSNLSGEHTKKGELLLHPISNGRGPVRIVTARQVKTRFKRMAGGREFTG